MAEVDNIRYPVPGVAFIKKVITRESSFVASDDPRRQYSRVSVNRVQSVLPLSKYASSSSRFSNFFSHYKWTDVGVLSYDEKTKLFTVITLTDPHIEHKVSRWVPK